MGKIVRPHYVILAPPFQVAAADRIVEETGKDLIADVLARVFGERRRVLAAEAAKVIIPLLDHEGEPARFVFHGHELEFRVSLQHAVENEIEKRVRDVRKLQVDAAAVTLDAFSFLAVVAVTGQDVHADGRFQVLGRRPEFVVVAGMKREIRMGRLPDQRAPEPRLAAAFQLLDRVVDVINRDGRNADEAVPGDAAVFDQPIVVKAKARFLQPGILESIETQEERRIEHLGGETVDFHLPDPRVRILSPLAPLESFAELVRRKERRGFAVFSRHALLPEINRLHHVRIRRNDDPVDPPTPSIRRRHVAPCFVGYSKNSPSRATTGTRLFSFESPGIVSPRMLSRPEASLAPTRQPIRTSTSGSLLVASNQ